MSDTVKYKQCKLSKGSVQQTAWIPEKFAVKGKFIRLKDDNGWEVLEVYGLAVDEKQAVDRSRDFTKTRKASDI